MSFLAPAAFAFAALIPVVILFYLLKRKRVAKLVSSTVLWQKFLAETQASAPFQRLRHNWLLLLQLLLLLLAILALARPYFQSAEKPANLNVVILDASASMQATDASPSRFELARAQALKFVDGLRENDRFVSGLRENDLMVVLQAAGNTEVKQSETSDKHALRRALNACRPMDSPTRLVPALKMAESLIRDRPGAAIHLFSDGAVPELTEFANQALPLVFHRVGNRADNLGLTALDVRINPENPTQRAVFTSVANFSSNSVDTEVELLLDDRLIETRPLTVGPGETSPMIFRAAQEADGIFTLRLTAKDDLAVDNQAAIVSLLPKPVKVLLVTRGNNLLEKALRHAGAVQLSVASDLTDEARGFELVVLDNVVPSTWPAGNILAFRVAGTNWFDRLDTVEGPPIVDWRGSHPLLRYVQFDNVAVRESAVAATPSWAVSLLECPQGALAVAGELDRRRIVWLGFDVLDSNWPLRVTFPIFMANAVEWLNPASAREAQFLVRAGEPFRLNLPAPVASARITLPDGTERDLAPDENVRELLFTETFKQGIYRLRAGTNDLAFCVNLLDAAESNIRPHEEIRFGEFARVEATTGRSANAEVWRWLALAALAVLAFEWWWYHKRTA
jgi:Ca-activated chloride channel family protein